MNNIEMLYDTLSIIENGCYEINGETVELKLSRKQMEEALVYLPEDIEEIARAKDISHVHRTGRVGYGCLNMDSFALARRRMEQFSGALDQNEGKPVLVLNLANPVNPGGGVRHGARAQEEDLCRKSTLLVSLEGENAAPYYKYNQSLDTYMGSDAVIIHPQVEIIKDDNGDLLPKTVIVAVMTCAAPMLTYGMEGMSHEEYESMVYHRITGMLKVAAYSGYRYLVLGAFGCGAFDNDAAVVSDLFREALLDFDYDGMSAEDMFRRIDFAVLDRSSNRYKYNEFARNFSDFYKDEDME